MSTSWRLAKVNIVFVVVLLSAVGVLAALEDPSLIITRLWSVPIVVLLALLGALIIRQHPDNAIGAGMCLLAAVLALGSLTEAYFLFEKDDGTRLASYELAAWLTTWVTMPAVIAPITVLFLLCPDGKLPSHKWQPVLIFEVASILVLTLTTALTPGPLESFSDVDNPMAFTAIGSVLDIAQYVAYILLVPAVALSGAALIHRFRRSHGRERQQLKWLALAAIAAFLLFALSWPLSILVDNIWDITPLIALCFLPIATAIAILRHQLYDIDRILNRTLVYALLTACLGALYLGVVVGLQALLSSVAGGSDLAIVITTLLVAALFLPARRRVQEIVDRRFNRRAYDAARTIDAFSARLRQQIDLDTLRYELLAVTEETMQPSRASVWLRRR